MKKKLLIVIPLILVLAVVCGVLLTRCGSQKNQTTENTTSSAVSALHSENGTERQNSTINLTPDTVSLVVYAPKHCEVLFDSEKIPYDEAVNCYRLFTETDGKHTVTISKYGYHTVTKEIDFDREQNAEINVDLTMTDEFPAEIEKAAQDEIIKFIEICADGSGDLSSFNFYTQQDKAKARQVVDGVINDLSVDTEEYTTGKLTVSGLKCDGMLDSHKTLSWNNDPEGCVVNFTLDYNYTWEYNGENYQNSGIDSEIQHPYIKMDYIDGQWYVREVYMYMRKSIH